MLRVGIHLSRQRAEGFLCLYARFAGYILRRGYHSVLSTVRVSYDLRERTSRSKIPRFLFVVIGCFILVRVWVFYRTLM